MRNDVRVWNVEVRFRTTVRTLNNRGVFGIEQISFKLDSARAKIAMTGNKFVIRVHEAKARQLLSLRQFVGRQFSQRRRRDIFVESQTKKSPAPSGRHISSFGRRCRSYGAWAVFDFPTTKMSALRALKNWIRENSCNGLARARALGLTAFGFAEFLSPLPK